MKNTQISPLYLKICRILWIPLGLCAAAYLALALAGMEKGALAAALAALYFGVTEAFLSLRIRRILPGLAALALPLAALAHYIGQWVL